MQKSLFVVAKNEIMKKQKKIGKIKISENAAEIDMKTHSNN